MDTGCRYSWSLRTTASGEDMQHSDSLEVDIDTHREVSIIDKDETASKACHIVDGFVLEDSRQPFPVRFLRRK